MSKHRIVSRDHTKWIWQVHFNSSLSRYRITDHVMGCDFYSLFMIGYCPILRIIQASVRIYEDFDARGRYLRQGYVISSHSLLWDVITYPCLRYLLLATKSSYVTGISNFIPQFIVGCNYLSLPEILASGNKVLICDRDSCIITALIGVFECLCRCRCRPVSWHVGKAAGYNPFNPSNAGPVHILDPV